MSGGDGAQGRSVRTEGVCVCVVIRVPASNTVTWKLIGDQYTFCITCLGKRKQRGEVNMELKMVPL